MKTRSQDRDTTHGLPPPPAPTARDANPWTYGGGGQPRAAVPPGVPTSAPPGVPPGKQHRPRFPARQVEHPKPRQPPVVPLLILAVLALVPLGAALRALAAGAVDEAIGPLIAVGFIAFMAWRRLRSRRS
jgi:hypothetical protein